MPNNLTDKEIKKALECCIKSSHFGECFENECPLVSEKGCKVGKETLYPYALDLINRQEGRIHQQEKTIMEIQNANLIDFKGTIANYKAENESLKAEVERLKKVEERHMRLYHLLLDPVIVANGKNGELRPIKRTSRQEVYHTLLRAQEIMKIPHRWFPWKRDGDNK